MIGLSCDKKTLVETQYKVLREICQFKKVNSENKMKLRDFNSTKKCYIFSNFIDFIDPLYQYYWCFINKVYCVSNTMKSRQLPLLENVSRSFITKLLEIDILFQLLTKKSWKNVWSLSIADVSKMSRCYMILEQLTHSNS